MGRIFLLTVAVLLIGAVTAFALGELAPNFTLKDMKNKDFRLGDHLGNEVIVLSFWMSWCKPCMVEMPQLERLYKKYKSKGLLVVSVNADEPSGLAKAKTIVRQKRLTCPVVFDSSTEVTALFNPNKAFPYTILIDKDKKIVYVKTGFSAGDEKILEEKIKELLAE